MSFTTVKDHKLPILFYLYLLVPLFYFPDSQPKTMLARFWMLIFISIIILMSDDMQKTVFGNFSKLKGIVKWPLTILIVLVFVSTFFSKESSGLVWFGVNPEYLGVVSWLIFILLAILFANNVKDFLLTRTSMYIFGVLAIISIVGDRFYILNGLRLSGVMFQPTTMAAYAVVGCIIAIHNISKIKNKKYPYLDYTILGMFFSIVILSQSRIAYIVLLIVLSVLSIYSFKLQKLLPTVLTLMILLIGIFPFVKPAYFSRYQSDSVKSGASYRLDLYTISFDDTIKNNLIVGNGANTLPTAINNQNIVPEEIAKTLQLGSTFSSTHNLFFDIAYFFGFLSALIFAHLTVLALIIGYKTFKKEIAFNLIFFTLLANAFFNVPSLELTSLLFIVLLGVLYKKDNVKEKQRI